MVFAFHSYRRAVHAVLHGRPNKERFHVRGFMKEGTTTTPFDTVVRNEMSRFHFCMEAVRRAAYPEATPLTAWCEAMLARHRTHIREHSEDLPGVRDWKWSDP